MRLTVNFHHDGNFVPSPLMYQEGDESTIHDIKFEGMTVARLSKMLQETCVFPVKGYAASDFVGEDDVVIPNRSINDPFLNKLCNGSYINDFSDKPDVGESSQPCGKELEIDSDDEDVGKQFKLVDRVIYPGFDPKLPWNEMKPTLDLRFEHPEQLKDCLTNYGVANGYQLWYRRNDYRSLFILCGRDLAEGRSGSKKDPTITYRYIQEQIKKKYLINVSVGQCKRAKQMALFDHEGGLVEHYSRLWDYKKQILDTNPGSSVHLHVDEKDDGKIYFKRIYICFKAMIEGRSAGCRKVIGLDGCFLKGTCKGELLTAMGRDKNNQMFPIAWAVIGTQTAGVELSLKWTKVVQLMKMVFLNLITITLELLEERNRAFETIPNILDSDLSGVPCVHSVATFSFLKNDPILEEPPLPPVLRNIPDRPRKLRIKHVTERVNVITRSGRMMTCQNCWEKGHNKKGCKKEKQPKPIVKKRAPGRKEDDSNFVFQTCNKDGGDVDPSSAGPSVADPSSAGPSVAYSIDSGTQTITEDPIVADPIDDIPTSMSKTSDTAKIIEDAIATGRLKTTGLKRRCKSERIAKRAKAFQFGKDGAGSCPEKAWDVDDVLAEK
nr:60S ribosomal protein L34 [Tanacetum cinerariifolium]